MVTPAYSDEVALVHDYFIQDGGAERVAIELAQLLPRARVYTSFFDERIFGERLDPGRVHTWPFQGRIRTSQFRSLLQLYPLYFSTLDLRAARLVVSNSSAFAKAVRTARPGIHVAYVQTPMRFAYDTSAYLARSSFGLSTRTAARLLRAPLAEWDRRTAGRPHLVVANSRNVRGRIRARWGRDARIIYPPVNVHELGVTGQDDGFLLIAARLLAYRRIDLAVRAANAARRQLVVVGDGPERRRLEAMAGPTVRFTGFLSRPELIDLFERCTAYLVPGEEDFGIAPVEAMAAGKPVVAYARGGVTETVIDGQTGVMFEEPTPRSLARALDRLDRLALDPAAARAQAERFSRPRFFEDWRALLGRLNVDPALYSADGPL